MTAHASRAVAVLGASGYIGGKVIAALARDRRSLERIVALDVREPDRSQRLEGVVHETLDVRSARLAEVLADHRVDTVVHLAAIVAPPAGMTCPQQYGIDVDGTHNVLEACKETGVGHVTVLSSGAVYGAQTGDATPLKEDAPLRDDEWLYARHKRLVEELLARYRAQHPSLAQLIFRPAIALGRETKNQISAFFEKPLLFDIAERPARFSFVLDDDLTACVIFNVAADGTMDALEIARHTGARRVCVGAGSLCRWIRLLRFFGLTQYAPEQVAFLRHRPVLANDALKREFGFSPTLTSKQVFETWWSSRKR
jgi:UDP-glucose 4-epimerase